MSTRTKILICVGLLALAAGVVMVRILTVKPAVEVSFVRYTRDGATAVVHLTNRTETVIICEVPDGLREVGDSHGRMMFYNFPDGGCTVRLSWHGDCKLEVSLNPPAATVCVRCRSVRSDVRQRMESLLRRAGVNITRTGFVATVDLPPIETNATTRATNQSATR